MVHGCGRGHGAGVKGLHLIGAETIFFQPDGQVHHVFVAGAGVGRDEIGDQVLLFARLGAVLVKQLLEAVVAANAGLHHFGQGARLGVLGGDFQIAAHMVGGQFADVFRGLNGQVVAQT